MERRRPTSSERLLLKLEQEDSQRQEERGILELFEPDEDAPLARDDSD